MYNWQSYQLTLIAYKTYKQLIEMRERGKYILKRLEIDLWNHKY